VTHRSQHGRPTAPYAPRHRPGRRRRCGTPTRWTPWGMVQRWPGRPGA